MQRQRNDTTRRRSKSAPTTTTPRVVSEHASQTDILINQLHEHVEQGRIFDARSVVHELSSIEDTNALKSIQHIIDDVIEQADHVESLLQELHSDDDWTLAKQSKGITVHFRKEANSSIHTVRASTTFDNFSPSDFVKFCSLFVETELMHKWFPANIMNPANLLSWHSKYSKVIQLHINIPIFLISNRDAIVQGNGYHLPDRNAFLISTRSILTDTCQYCDIPKPSKGVVRMNTESIFFVQLVKSDVISFKMIGKDDLKLKYLPTPLLNYISQGHMPFDLIKSVHRTIRNFEGSEWEAMIEKRGTYYKEIEDKVLVTLENWEKEGGDINNASLQVGNSVNNKRDTMKEEIPTNTVYYAGNKDVYSLNDESKSMRPGHIGMFLIMITAVIGTLLYSLAYREMNILHDTVVKHIHEMSYTTRNNILLTILVMAIPILFMIRWRRKKPLKDKEKDINNNTDMVDDNDEGYNDFLRMLADKGTEEGQQDGIDDISQLSEITSSPRSSPKRITKLIPVPTISTPYSNSPSRKLRKRDRVLKGIKKAASLPVLDIGKKKKNG